MARQARRVAYVNGTVFTTLPVEALARELAALAPGDLDHAYFLCSGSEAVEAACKLARQYWVEVGRPTKQRLIALRPGYHGNTLLALSASARAHYKALYGEWLVDVAFVPAPYPYRCGCRPEGAMCDTCANGLERTIVELGPDTVAAFIAEPVGGSSTGASVPHPDYFRRVREVCDRYEVLFIADEVLSGAGRTGTWTAIEQFGVVPDIMTMGKGITGGYAPLSAVFAPRRLLDPIQHGTGALVHAQTFSHHAVLCAAGLAALRYIKRRDLVARCRAIAPQLHQELESLREIAIVGDVRGRGLLAGIELVADRASRAPFPRQMRIAERVAAAALEEGLTVWPNVGQANGTDGDLVLIAPPFIIDTWEIQELVARLGKAIRRVAATFPVAGRVGAAVQ
jgi:adenosylmethionine-8-amino-7-oxononanoate aminotransferase